MVAASLVMLGPLALLLGPASPGSAAAVSRPADPVVLTGGVLPTLRGAGVTALLGFRATATGWTQIPIQIDERAVLDLGRVYHGAPNGVRVTGYTSSATWANADPVAGFDADDELAFMARDAGPIATTGAAPTGAAAGSGVAVRITDPLVSGSASYVYLFRRAAGSTLAPGAGKQYVRYTFNLLSGPYKTTYRLNAGPNPENSTATGATYRHHFSDRWLSDELHITAAGASGVDILDRHKALFAPGYCGRSENTFDAGEGAFIVNKVGAVRAIRSYIGANSGPFTQREHVFYDRREDIRTSLRVHAIPSVMDFFDYSRAASGMRYRNALNPAGVIIDGVPDSPTAGYAAWEQVTGAQGTLTMVGRLVASFTPTKTSYYLDDATPPVTQCTGDAFAYGSSGMYLNGAIPCTDPALGCVDRLSAVRTMYFDAPGGTAASAIAYRNAVNAPLVASVTAWP